MRITKKQLTRIIAEEKARLQEMKMQNEAEIFSEDFYYDLLVDHVEARGRRGGDVLHPQLAVLRPLAARARRKARTARR